MATRLRWLGHGTWFIESGNHRLILDPFLDNSPVAPVKCHDIQVDYVLISHGHFDHIADAESIAKTSQATVISTFEVCNWLEQKGVTKSHAMNIGGSFGFDFGRLKMTPAWHTSTLPDGSYGGTAAGFLLFFPEGNVYFACDTGLFLDMQLIGEHDLALAVLPIGDNYTMGPDDALKAVTLLHPRRVVPAHVNTWPLLAQDVNAWAEKVVKETQTQPVVLNPGDWITL